MDQALSKPISTEESEPNNTQSQSETDESSSIETTDEIKYPKILECAAAEGFVTQESLSTNTLCNVRLTKHRDDENPLYKYGYDLYIEIDTGTAVLEKEIEANTSTLPADSLFLGDVDGDGVQEILIHNNTGGLGGFGLWRTRVLKVENDEIRILFENFDEFDTGFESRFLEGYQMEVKNNITGYTLIYDVKDKYGAYIDGSKTLPSGRFEIDPFYIFEPKDVDDDGISEILCKQYTFYIGHSDYTGTACSVLKFNGKTQAFEVIDAWYEPNAGQ